MTVLNGWKVDGYRLDAEGLEVEPEGDFGGGEDRLLKVER
jgi:hypothetical protein